MSTFCLDTLEFMQIRILPIIVILVAVSTYPAAAQTGILTDLYQLPPELDSRWASAENPTGERGQGGQENAGRKGRPALPLPAGKQLILAEVSGHSGTVRRFHGPIEFHRRPTWYWANQEPASFVAVAEASV